MKTIASTALACAALLMATTPAAADDGPVDFGIFQGINETKVGGLGGTTDGTTGGTAAKSPLEMLADSLTSPGRQ